MASPFFKWAGSKRKLIPQLLPLLPGDVAERRHVEPFLGSGALFFALEPKTALLRDRNRALMCTYSAVRFDAATVHVKVKNLLKDPVESYYSRRSRFNVIKQRGAGSSHEHEVAALFLYLNRTCFNGLYRENPRGEFNVPVGRYKTVSCSKEELLDAQRLLKKISRYDKDHETYFPSQEWWETLREVESNDFVYIDPPYDGGFTAYTKDGFDEADQRDLAAFVRYLDAAVPNVRFMLSNADTPLIRELYASFDIQTIQAPRAINSKADGRGNVSEVVIRNYS